MLKTGQLELRPIYLRKAARTEGHALVTMLALKLVRWLDALAAPLGLTVDDMVERLGGIPGWSASGHPASNCGGCPTPFWWPSKKSLMHFLPCHLRRCL
jgi:hypothetical protein